MEALKVVFHVSLQERLTTAYHNIKNILKDRDDVTIALLINGGAAKTVVDDEKLKELLDLKIDVRVCNNSLKGLKLTEDDILEGITVVPTGVLELVYKQNEGYAYIRP